MGVIITPNPAPIEAVVKLWARRKPAFLWSPTGPSTLLLDRARGLVGKVVGTRSLTRGGILNPVVNSTGEYIEWATNAGIGTGAWFGLALVSVLTPSAVGGAFLKVGSDSDGIGYGGGNGAFETAGAKMIVLHEGVAWGLSTGSWASGFQIVAFGRDSSTTSRLNNTTTATNAICDGSPITPSARVAIQGYTTSRGSNIKVHALALFPSESYSGTAFDAEATRSGAELKHLWNLPTQAEQTLFAPLPRRIWVPSAGGGNATATLTGASTTSSAGTLSATGHASKTLPGASTTASAGTVSASASTNASTTLTGAATTASAGTLAATGGAAVTLAGTGTTASAGTVTATAGGNATVTLPSASTTSSAGTLSATGDASKTLSGASTTASAGAVLASAGTNASITLTGASTSAAVGALSASGAAQIVLTGVQITASAGTITATGVRNASVTLTGTAATSYAGSVSAYAGILNVFTRPPKSATLYGKSRQVAVLLSRPDRDIGNILKD